MRSQHIPGIVSGLAGMLTFLIIHHFWISPIWFVLPVGLLIAVLGGMAVGWSYRLIQHRLPQAPFRSLSVMGIVTATLLPAVIFGLFRQPLLDVSLSVNEPVPSVSLGYVLTHIALELLLPAALIGALIGWWRGGNARAAAATGLAGFIFALGPGHNIPIFIGDGRFLAPTYLYAKSITLLVAPIVISSVVLVSVARWQRARHGVEHTVPM